MAPSISIPASHLLESNFLPPVLLPLRSRRGACFGIILFSRGRGECNVVRPTDQPGSRLRPRGEAKWDNPEGKGPEKERVSQHVKFKPRRMGELAEPRYQGTNASLPSPSGRATIFTRRTALRNKKDRLSSKRPRMNSCCGFVCERLEKSESTRR